MRRCIAEGGKKNMKVIALFFGMAAFLPMLWLQCPAANSPSETNYIKGDPQELNDNGAWSWFMDPRVIVDHDWLIVGSVRANGKFADHDRAGWGNVELSILNLKSRALRVVVLHEGFEQ